MSKLHKSGENTRLQEYAASSRILNSHVLSSAHFNYYFLMMEAKLTLIQNMKVVALWIIFPMPQESSNLELFRLRYDQNTIEWSEFCSAFDHRVALLFFDILTRQTIELDFYVFIPNVYLSLIFKMVQ